MFIKVEFEAVRYGLDGSETEVRLGFADLADFGPIADGVCASTCSGGLMFTDAAGVTDNLYPVFPFATLPRLADERYRRWRQEWVNWLHSYTGEGFDKWAATAPSRCLLINASQTEICLDVNQESVTI